jgi:hypothetical protein
MNSIDWLIEKVFSDFGKCVKNQEITMAKEMLKHELIKAYNDGIMKGYSNGYHAAKEKYDDTNRKTYGHNEDRTSSYVPE